MSGGWVSQLTFLNNCIIHQRTKNPNWQSLKSWITYELSVWIGGGDHLHDVLYEKEISHMNLFSLADNTCNMLLLVLSSHHFLHHEILLEKLKWQYIIFLIFEIYGDEFFFKLKLLYNSCMYQLSLWT